MFEEDEFEILKKQAEGLEVPVRDNVWKNIRSRIGKSQNQNVRLKKMARGIFVLLLVGIGFLYTLENKEEKKLNTSHESQNLTDTMTNTYIQNDGHASPGNHYFSVPGNSSEENYPPVKELIAKGAASELRKRGNNIKKDMVKEDLTHHIDDIDFKFYRIASRPLPTLELSLSHLRKDVPNKLKARKSGMRKPQKRIIFSSVDIGLGSNFIYSKKQPQTSNALEQSYARYISNVTEKMLPLSGIMMVNFELPGRLSLGTGVQFLHLREKVSYELGYDSIVEIIDDRRGNFDTNIYYFDRSSPGIGYKSESRTTQLQLPLLMNMSWELNKKLNVGINAGLAVGFYSSHRSNSKHGDIPGIASFMVRQNHSVFLYSLGVQASIGFGYRISAYSSIGLKLNYYKTVGIKSEPINTVARSFGSDLVYRLNIR